MLPAKAKYLQRDTQRAADRVSKPNFRTPRDFIKAALTTSAQRALHHIKANYPRATFISAWHFLFHKFWTPPNVNLTVEENLRAALAAATETPAGGRRLFSDEDVRGIMDGREGMKEALKKETGRAVELGAFGAPWFWVTDAQGKGEAFFGSDRYADLALLLLLLLPDWHTHVQQIQSYLQAPGHTLPRHCHLAAIKTIGWGTAQVAAAPQNPAGDDRT